MSAFSTRRHGIYVEAMPKTCLFSWSIHPPRRTIK